MAEPTRQGRRGSFGRCLPAAWRAACLLRLLVEALEAEWFTAMRRADFEAAWRVGDRILAARPQGAGCWHLPRHEQWVWDGRPLAGERVLVRCYHGLGDTIQFARFLPQVAELARALTVWVQPALIPLLRTLRNAESMHFEPLNDGTPQVDYDVDIEIMELGHALRVHACDLGRHVPYFNVDAAPRVADCFSIGVVRETGGWDDRRTLPPDLLERLRVLSSVELCSLQLEHPLEGVRDLSTPDLFELARRLRALDLVITPDTMLAHLAGALAVPTWTLLPAEADWRWHQPDRTGSPWYPTMCLWRQPRAGDWQSVIDAVIDRLEGTASLVAAN